MKALRWESNENFEERKKTISCPKLWFPDHKRDVSFLATIFCLVWKLCVQDSYEKTSHKPHFLSLCLPSGCLHVPGDTSLNDSPKAPWLHPFLLAVHGGCQDAVLQVPGLLPHCRSPDEPVWQRWRGLLSSLFQDCTMWCQAEISEIPSCQHQEHGTPEKSWVGGV